MPYPGGIGGHAARPTRSLVAYALRLPFKIYEELRYGNFFEKTLAISGTFGGSPIVAPEGGLALPGVPQCSCTPEPPRARKVSKDK